MRPEKVQSLDVVAMGAAQILQQVVSGERPTSLAVEKSRNGSNVRGDH